MQEVRVKLETVTPMFLGGAEARGAPPELRPPSFRGAMRYWLRALLGGVYGNNLDKVSTIEGDVFGSASADNGSASAINLRIIQSKFSEEAFTRSNTSQGEEPPGSDYLYWSMARSGNPDKNNYQPPKHAIKPGTQFELSLSTRPGASKALLFDYSLPSLWLAMNLGGIGARSRRTAGSFSPANPLTSNNLDFHINTAPRAEIAIQIGKAIQTMRAKLGISQEKIQIDPPSEFDILHPNVCQIWVLGVWDNPNSAINVLGKRMRDFRNRREPDHRNVAKWLDENQPPQTIERSVFGLPIPYRYTPRNGEQALSGTIQGRLQNPMIDRRSSPLWLTVNKLHPKGYVGIATLFHSRFLPENEKLHAKKRRANLHAVEPPADYTLIQEWIAEQFPTVEAVNYD